MTYHCNHLPACTCVYLASKGSLCWTLLDNVLSSKKLVKVLILLRKTLKLSCSRQVLNIFQSILKVI